MCTGDWHWARPPRPGCRRGPDAVPRPPAGGPVRAPGHPGLGVLGQPGLTASVTRARHLAAACQPLSKGAGDPRAALTARDHAVVLPMDGLGTPSVKQETWDAVTAAAPSRVSFGWKDFLARDHPMETSKQTLAHPPAPVIITYQ